jgi:hypothetical protein
VKRYRLEIIEIGVESDTSLGAIEGSAELVAQLAPTVIESAIGDELDEPVADGSGARFADEPSMPKQRRKRRTKAQIAADNAAAAVAEQRVADGAPAESAPAASSEPAPAGVDPTPAPPASDTQAAPYDPFA